ncbi:hypothetical protein [Pedobacter faecalis]|uniref:hypothetical protein n=1 Tax=Pedobacter faecalis TaxID=3041495 RepID=UPI00254E95F3|nr:hypothetical protein [Pedobacter sp. ELA7]
MIEKVSIGDVVEFSRKSPTSQVTMANKLKKPKSSDEKKDGGGNYWANCLSAIKSALKKDSHLPISEKITQLEKTLRAEKIQRNKDRWQRNLDILHGFEDFDFSTLQPRTPFEVLKGLDEKMPLIIEDLPIKVKPDYIVSFEDKGVKMIGAVLFVGKKKKFERENLAVFADALYRYLSKNKGAEYQVSKTVCTVVDFITLRVVRYSGIDNESLTSSLDEILRKIRVLVG